MWVNHFGLDFSDPADAELDFDQDGLTNLQEYRLRTNPILIYSDNDGLSDGDEVNIHQSIVARYRWRWIG
jgi:hypothetical protein